MKAFRLKNRLSVVTSDGTILQNSNCTDEMYNEVMELIRKGDEDEVINFMRPNFNSKMAEYEEKKSIFEKFKDSKIFTVKGQSLYIESISQLSVPQDLAERILKAEIAQDQNLIDTYLNFWTLTCTNPDSRVRNNMFWFLERYGMNISKSGLFIAYRNVYLKSKGSIDFNLAKFISQQYFNVVSAQVRSEFSPSTLSPSEYVVCADGPIYSLKTLDEIEQEYYEYNDEYEEEDIHIGNLATLYDNLKEEDFGTTFTDGYTRTFNIKIGEPVTMDRKACDSMQENSCSRGLHVAGKDWLQSNYFGDVGLMVLVNPADVVAVPPVDDYGKMRTCAYYPIKIVARNEEGNITDEEVVDGFEDDFMERIVYTGAINEQDDAGYEYAIPNIPEINRTSIIDRLESISNKLKNKIVE